MARASLLVASSTVATAVSALIRNKLVAVTIGPAGMGLYGQLAGLQQGAVIIASAGLIPALVRGLASQRSADSPESAARQIGQVGALQVLLSVTGVLAAVLAARPIAGWALGNDDLAWAVRVAAAGLPAALLTQVLQSIAVAGGHVRRYVVALLWDVSLGTILAIVLVSKFRFQGAVAYLCSGPYVSAVVTLIVLGRLLPPGVLGQVGRRLVGPDGTLIRRFAAFGAAIAVAYVARQAVVAVVRSVVIHKLGTFDSGLFQAAYSQSTYYISFFTQPLIAVAYPQLSAHSEPMTRRLDYRRWVDLVVAIVPVLLMLYIASLTLLVPLLNSNRFVGAVPIAAWQSVGDFFFIILWLNRMHLFAQGRVLAGLWLELMLDLGVLVLVQPFLSWFGVEGAGVAHLVSSAAVMAFSLFRYDAEDALQIVSGLLLPVAGLLLGAASLSFHGWRQVAGMGTALVVVAIPMLKHRGRLVQMVGQLRTRKAQ
jgi:PST family polysaccharide transporter